MKFGAKNKILTTISIFSIIAINLVFVTPAKAAISSGGLISLANSARAAAGVHQLTTNSALSSSAYAKAKDMLKYDYFAHTSPQGKTPWSFIKGAGYSYIYAGENLAIDFSSTTAVHNAWMASSSHRSNILDTDFTEIGIAVISGEFQGRNTMVVVQHFGARATVSQPSSSQDSEPIISDQLIDQNINQEIKQTLKLKPKKIELPVAENSQLNIDEKSVENIIWYTSPILILIKTLS